MAVLGKRRSKGAEDPVSGLAKTTRFLASERTVGVFCTTHEDDFTSVFGQSAVPCGSPSCASGEQHPAALAEQLGGLWQKCPADLQKTSLSSPE